MLLQLFRTSPSQDDVELLLREIIGIPCLTDKRCTDEDDARDRWIDAWGPPRDLQGIPLEDLNAWRSLLNSTLDRIIHAYIPCKRGYAERARTSFIGFVRMMRQLVRIHRHVAGDLKRKRECHQGRIGFYYCIQESGGVCR
jgi:hypothetical protein